MKSDQEILNESQKGADGDLTDWYQAEVNRTVGTLRGRDTINMAAMGLAGELGEVIEPIKKYLFHGQERPTRDSMEKELGDMLWYLTALATEFDVSLIEMMERNVIKLRRRHPKGFDRSYHDEQSDLSK